MRGLPMLMVLKFVLELGMYIRMAFKYSSGGSKGCSRA